MQTVAITGSSGFIGRALTALLQERGFRPSAIPHELLAEAQATELRRRLEGIEILIHCAGLTPRRGRKLGPGDFDLANHLFTRNLALAAADSGTKRLIYLSSIAAISGHAGILRADLRPNPVGEYGRSKAKAEAFLLASSKVPTLVVRPPLVYGAGAKGDLGLLVKLANSRVPLPFGAVRNRRSMVSVTNLVDALHFLMTAPDPFTTKHIFHVSDGRPLSLPEIVASIRAGLGRSPNLVSVPPALLSASLRLLGMSQIGNKLLGDLEVDISELTALGWRPPADPEPDLRAMASALLAPGTSR